MKLTYHLRVVCIARNENCEPIVTKFVEVKNETYESLAEAAREARQWCEHQAFACFPAKAEGLE